MSQTEERTKNQTALLLAGRSQETTDKWLDVKESQDHGRWQLRCACEHSPLTVDNPPNWGEKNPVPTVVTSSGLMPLVPANYPVVQHSLFSRGSSTAEGSQVAMNLLAQI